MYYTTSGSYKKTKMIIDYTNIVLTVAATVIFIILFLRSRSGILFPIEFLLGTIVNALTSVKHFINGNKVSGLIVAVVAVMLAIMTVVTALIVL